MAPEFLFERGERTVRQLRKFFDRNILEDVVVDDLFEILLGRVDVAQQFALQAAVFVRGDEVDQFGHFDVLGRLVAVEILVAQVVVGVDEKLWIEFQAGIETCERLRQFSHECSFEMFSP